MIAPIGGVGGPLSLTPEGRYVQGANVGLNTSFQGYILCISTTPPPGPPPLPLQRRDGRGENQYHSTYFVHKFIPNSQIKGERVR